MSTFTEKEIHDLAFAIKYRMDYLTEEELVASVRPEFLMAVAILYTNSYDEKAQDCLRKDPGHAADKVIQRYGAWVDILAKVKEVV